MIGGLQREPRHETDANHALATRAVGMLAQQLARDAERARWAAALSPRFVRIPSIQPMQPSR